MNEKRAQINIIAIGMAMFSMFFGSGNIIFPVLIGQATQNQAIFAIFGLLLTAVLVPFIGLLSLSLYDGKYLEFFKRLGTAPGWGIVILIMGLIGPFAVIPRCIVIAHSTISTFLTQIDLTLFSLASCGIIYFCTYKRRRILEVLGLYLTPILLLSLIAIIFRGLVMEGDSLGSSSFTELQAFGYGLLEGYNTMDLFASFMFSSVVLGGIKKADENIVKQPRNLLRVYLKASVIGMGLLGTIYMGMCYIAARHGHELSYFAKDRLLSQLTLKILGPYAGIIVCVAVSFACLTTAISLSLVFTEFMYKEVSQNKWKYKPTLLATLGISFVVSTLQFTGIQAILVPILQVSLPALMVLTLINLLHKLYGVRIVKIPVFATFVVTLIYHVFI